MFDPSRLADAYRRISELHADLAHEYKQLAIDFGAYRDSIAVPDRVRDVDLSNILLDDLELSSRSYNCLKEAGIVTVQELINKTPKELLDLDGFGRISLADVRQVLRGAGLSLAKESKEREKA